MFWTAIDTKRVLPAFSASSFESARLWAIGIADNRGTGIRIDHESRIIEIH